MELPESLRQAIENLSDHPRRVVASSLGVFWMMRTGWYPPEKRSVNLDSDWSYRWLAPRIVRGIGRVVSTVDGEIGRAHV